MKRISTATGTLVLLATLGVPGVAGAAPRTHDGFHLRLGMNLGPLNVHETVEVGALEQESDIGGFGAGIDVLLGGTVAPGLVLGGGLVYGQVQDPKVETGAVSANADGTMLFVGIPFFVTYYLLGPAEGLFVQGMLGGGAVDFVSTEGQSGGNDPTGLIVGLGVGYDFWIGNEWSVGPMARLVHGALSAEANGAKATDSTTFVTVGAGFTYH